MAKGKRIQKNRFDRRTTEAMSARINKLMSGQKFDSIDEANKWFAEIATGTTLGDSKDDKPETPLEEAQFLMWEAFSEPAKKKRISMAEKALKISPDCADAYVLLAEETARNSKEAMALYRKGREAGRRALGDEFTNPQTQFWISLKTRPYMRAVDGLARSTYDRGFLDEAIELWHELLHLNKTDNQGIRFELAPALLENDRLDEAEELFKKYPNDSNTFFAYTRALCLFKKHGFSATANEALSKAILSNTHVMMYLIGLSEPPEQRTDLYSPGSPEEAHAYFSQAFGAWYKTKGAIDWLFDYMDRESKRKMLTLTFPGLTVVDGTNNPIDRLVQDFMVQNP